MLFYFRPEKEARWLTINNIFSWLRLAFYVFYSDVGDRIEQVKFKIIISNNFRWSNWSGTRTNRIFTEYLYTMRTLTTNYSIICGE